MLGVLLVEISWGKPCHTPPCAELRKPYLQPVLIPEDISLHGDGIFSKNCFYSQHTDGIVSDEKNHETWQRNYQNKTKNQPFTSAEEKKQHHLLIAAEQYRKNRGYFTEIQNLEIPCVEITPEKNHFKVKFFDFKRGAFVRNGHNEDFWNPQSRLCGQNILNETAFILKENESGKIEFNYRFQTQFDMISYYSHYCVYLVNVPVLTHDVFLRKYDYHYRQIDRLF